MKLAIEEAEHAKAELERVREEAKGAASRQQVAEERDRTCPMARLSTAPIACRAHPMARLSAPQLHAGRCRDRARPIAQGASMQVLTPAPRPSPQVAAETELGRLLKEQRAHYESMIHQLKHEYEEDLRTSDHL